MILRIRCIGPSPRTEHAKPFEGPTREGDVGGVISTDSAGSARETHFDPGTWISGTQSRTKQRRTRPGFPWHPTSTLVSRSGKGSVRRTMPAGMRGTVSCRSADSAPRVPCSLAAQTSAHTKGRSRESFERSSLRFGDMPSRSRAAFSTTRAAASTSMAQGLFAIRSYRTSTPAKVSLDSRH